MQTMLSAFQLPVECFTNCGIHGAISKRPGAQNLRSPWWELAAFQMLTVVAHSSYFYWKLKESKRGGLCKTRKLEYVGFIYIYISFYMI